mmetsp:Transcript_67690/g.170780  ORF Transcript_67690/g.170780 Transcript_67690/m.170780 type:complete len:200 (-) Transcript_67690:810-1409(-)
MQCWQSSSRGRTGWPSHRSTGRVYSQRTAGSRPRPQRRPASAASWRGTGRWTSWHREASPSRRCSTSTSPSAHLPLCPTTHQLSTRLAMSSGRRSSHRVKLCALPSQICWHQASGATRTRWSPTIGATSSATCAPLSSPTHWRSRAFAWSRVCWSRMWTCSRGCSTSPAACSRGIGSALSLSTSTLAFVPAGPFRSSTL